MPEALRRHSSPLVWKCHLSPDRIFQFKCSFGKNTNDGFSARSEQSDQCSSRSLWSLFCGHRWRGDRNFQQTEMQDFATLMNKYRPHRETVTAMTHQLNKVAWETVGTKSWHRFTEIPMVSSQELEQILSEKQISILNLFPGPQVGDTNELNLASAWNASLVFLPKE